MLTFQVAGQPVYASQGNLQMEIAQYPAYYGYTTSAYTILILRQGDNQDGISPFLELRNIGRWVVLPALSPPTSLSLSDFPDASFVLSRNPGGVTLYQGTIDTLTAVPEPETTTFLLLLAAGWLSRRRHGHS